MKQESTNYVAVGSRFATSQKGIIKAKSSQVKSKKLKGKKKSGFAFSA
jgi:hypothetical protein